MQTYQETYPSLSQDSILNEAILKAQQLLTAFAVDEKFAAKVTLAFGEGFNPERLEALRQQWLVEDFEDFPQIEVRSSAELNGANGAFAVATNTIYLSAEYLEENVGNLEAISGVVLEEYGHFVDAQVNELDASGDEGEIFSVLVSGVGLDEETVRKLKNEGDKASIALDGQVIQIERAEPNLNFDEIEISFRAFIPSPLVALGDIIPEIPFFTDVFSGDNRGFEYDSGRERSRAFQSVVVTVDPQRVSPIINTPELKWGQTTRYDSSQAQFDPDKPDWWWIPKDGATPNAKETLQVTNDNNRVVAKRISANEIEVSFHLDGGNPLALPGTPNINADLKIFIRQQEGKKAEYRLEGDHDGFPAYELYINRNRVYEHDPVKRNQGPFSLMPPAEFDFPETEFQSVPGNTAVIQGKAVNQPDNFNPANSPSHKRLLDENYLPEVAKSLAASSASLQSIRQGSGDYVYDNYSIVIDEMPSGLTPESFLSDIVKDLNKTINNTTFDIINKFKRRRRNFGTPEVGDIYDIDILGPDNGSVILTRLTNSHFTFSTIETKLLETGEHPEYGSREFGFEKNSDGSITFYTRGASRPGNRLIGFVGAPIQNEGWTSLIEGIKAEIERRGGQAQTPQIERHWISADSPLNSSSNSLQIPILNNNETPSLFNSEESPNLNIAAVPPNRLLYRIDYRDVANDVDDPVTTLTGTTDDAGNFAVNLPGGVNYIINFYNPTTKQYGTSTGKTPLSGSTDVGFVYVASPDEEDLDNDGLGIFAEFVAKTSFSNADTDSDGINDGIEINQGTDPLPIAAEVNLELDTLTQGLDALLRQFQSNLNEKVFGAQNLPSKGILEGLPLLGDTLKTASGTQFIQQFSNQIRDKLTEKLGNAEQGTLEQIRGALFELFGPTGLNLLKDSDDPGDQITGEDILYVLDGSEVRFNFDLGGKNTIADLSLPSEIGLPGLGFKFSDPNNPTAASPKANVNLDYTLQFGFGVDVDKKEFFFDTSPTKDLSLSLTPSFPNATASLGFLQVDAANKDSRLDFSVDLDDGEDGDNRLTPSELSNLRLTPKGTADINLRFDASLAGSSVLPSIGSDFKLHWDFVEDATAPTVNFENVELKLGTFFQNFASPVFEQIKKIIEPIQPLIDVLDKPVPVLDTFGRKFLDVTGSETDAPDGKVTLLDLVKLKEPDAKLDYIRAAKQALGFITTVEELSKTDATIKLGQFDFGSENIASPSFDLSAIDLEETSEEEDVVAQLKSLTPELKTFAEDITTTSGPEFPILTDPTQAFKLILGQPAELFTYNVPELRFDFGFEQFFPVLGPLGALIEGRLGARAKLALGFDTYGLAETGNPLDGFYISNKPDPSGPGGLQKPTQDPTKGRESGAELFAGLNASAAFNGGIVRGGVGGGILGTLTLLLNDLNKDGDPTKVHLNEFDPSCIFDPVTGNLSASLNAFIKIGFGFLSYTKRFTLAKTTLLDFAIGCNSEQRNDPLRNNGLATLLMEADSQFGLTEGDLRLNMGADFANERLIGGQLGTDGAEVFAINYVSGTANNATLSVSTSDVTREYTNASRIVAFAGKEDDSIVIADEVFTPASLEGEEGNDRIYGGSGNDTLKGGTGDDALFGGNGNDELLGGDGDDNLEGGAGADVIDGGANTDEGGDAVSYKDSPTGVSFVLDPSGSGFFLGSGGEARGDKLKNIEQLEGSNFNDVLLGNNSSRNTLEGLKGNDSLKGGKGKDILLGGEGADTLDGGEDRDWTGYITSTAGVYIDLATGRATGGEAQGDKLISIEDVKGSTYNDILIGSAAENYLDGFTGDDRIIGGGGGDILDGGGVRSEDPNSHGKDWVSYKTSPSGVNVSLKTGKGSGGDAQGDELVKAKDSEGKDTAYNSFENLEGSFFNDVLEGDIGDNTLKGLENDDTLRGDAGNDTLIGGAGADFLDGGAGIDWADYSASAAAVAINLQVGVGSGGDAQGDTFALVNGKSTVENLLGTNVADTLLGDDGDNEIDPGLSNSQNDEFDVVYGGNGNDLLTLDYSSNDDNGTGIFGGFTGSYIGFGPGLGFFRYTNDGSRFLDAVAFEKIERLDIIGTKKADQIFGGANDDTLLPGAGDDTIYGGLGSNTILADDGNDVVVDQDIVADCETIGNPGNSRIYLDGGRGIDTLSVDLSGVSAENRLDIRLESLDPSQENSSQLLSLSNGGAISNFEVFKDIKTDYGNDILTQLGRIDNNFCTGILDDIVNPGLGFDVVDGGFEDGVGDDLLILDYSLEDTGTGVRYSVEDPETGIPTTISLDDLDAISSLNSSLGGYYYRKTETGHFLDKVEFNNFERFNLTGTRQDDILIGGYNEDILTGNSGNDLLIGNFGLDQLLGGEGNDILIGFNSNLAPDYSRSGEIDILTGGTGSDEFWLGDSYGSYYNFVSEDDYAIITDFNSSEGDIIQLHGSAYDYSLVTTPNSIEIHGLGSELIAIIEGTSDLNLSSNYFEFLGNIG
jgi:Ca2+-binding RTX toxin-like protein